MSPNNAPDSPVQSDKSRGSSIGKSASVRRGRRVTSVVLKAILILSVTCLAVTCLGPLLVLESTALMYQDSFSVHNLVNNPTLISAASSLWQSSTDDHNLIETTKRKETIPTRHTKDGRIIADLSLEDLSPDVGFVDKPVARGVAGRPLDETPTIRDAKRAHIECDINVDAMAYWNDDPFDEVSPFSVSRTSKKEKFIVFTPDDGGWNNIRMSLEIIFVIAAATGRTLVLPPPYDVYLLHHDKDNQYRTFADFYPIDKLQKRVKTIDMADFLKHPDAPAIPVGMDSELLHKNAKACEARQQAPNSCFRIFEYMEATSTLVNVTADNHCIVFDEEIYQSGNEDAHKDDLIQQARIKQWCGENREVVYWKAAERDAPDVLFFDSMKEVTRLLTHFYVMLHFTNPRLDNLYRRFVRDYLRYKDSIYCAAGKIVKAIQAEALILDSKAYVDDEGAGAFSSLHVRRGDLQYPEVKISAAAWYNNTREVWRPNEILYVATDERNMSFFDDLAKHHELRFLVDYWELAGLGDLDPNYMGMIDTIVASRGRTFTGTWFSTFTACITRLRGYHGMSMADTWYSFLPKKTALHTWKVNSESIFAYENQDGWIGIDADVWPTRDAF